MADKMTFTTWDTMYTNPVSTCKRSSHLEDTGDAGSIILKLIVNRFACMD
jgi:hypothetical protein